MIRYNLNFKCKPIQEKNSSYISILIVEKIENNETIGDKIGIFEEDNVLEFDECIDVGSEEIREFITENFNNPKAVQGFIRRVTQ